MSSGRHVTAHRQSDDLASAEIENGRHEEPAFIRWNVGDVAGYDTIRQSNIKLPLQQVRRCLSVIGDRRAAILPFGSDLESVVLFL